MNNQSIDIRQIAENLILSLWGESDKLRERAEGVRLFLQEILKEGERIAAQEKALDGQQNNNPEPEAAAEE